MSKPEIMNWTEKDVAELERRGLSLEEVEDQLRKIDQGPAELDVERACTTGDGIHELSEKQCEECVVRFENRDTKISVSKFVPASGAASRMFRHLHQFIDGEDTALAEAFFRNLSDFAFFEKVERNFDYNFNDALSREQKMAIAKFLMSNEGLNFANIPKGLVPFHRDGNNLRSAFEEQLLEGVHYIQGLESLEFHFTVSPFFKKEIEEHLKTIAKKPEFNNHTFDFTLSIQEPSTDTIAANQNGEAFRESNGELLFRPGGHGALISNLEHNSADVVFIKNIDNVVQSDHLEVSVKWKKVLGGCLLDLREQTFDLIRGLQIDETGAQKKAEHFLREKLGISFEAPSSDLEKKQLLIGLLDRPLRVCGMVKNQGEPGGGPFWVKSPEGVSRPQIVEKAQLKEGNQLHMAALNAASHFNPVDLVCSMKRYDGSNFSLSEFVDDAAFFVSEKSKDGRSLRALELPGLWNGAMAHWNSFFVEVPLETFNPVKTVNDLLKPLHQPAR